MKAPRAVRKWTKEEDDPLLQAVAKFGNNWVEVAKRKCGGHG